MDLAGAQDNGVSIQAKAFSEGGKWFRRDPLPCPLDSAEKTSRLLKSSGVSQGGFSRPKQLCERFTAPDHDVAGKRRQKDHERTETPDAIGAGIHPLSDRLNA